jgi:2-methylcitrate dehydratase PrpD
MTVESTPESTESATRRLARFAAEETDFARLPAEVTERLAQCLLDFIGVTALGAREAESSPAILAAAAELAAGRGKARVIGVAHTWPAEYAAFLNGAFAHSLDFDDTYIDGGLHPGAAVIPAALAAVDSGGITGPEELLTALAVGYETACRVGAALGQGAYLRGFHPTAIAGTFGALAAAGRVRSVSAGQLDAAFGLAGSMAAGSMQYLASGAWNKRLHPGIAARNALTALALAASGVTGAASALDGDLGVLNAYSAQPDPAQLTAGLGDRWTLVGTGIKPYPSCRLTHGAVDAARRLREAVPGDVLGTGRFEVVISPEANAIVAGPDPHKLVPLNSVDAQFSVYFQIAAALLDGNVTWAGYRRVGDPAISELTSRISVTVDEKMKPAGARLSWLSADGTRVIEQVVDEPSGEPGTGLSWDLVEAKFHAAAAAAYDAETRREIVATIRGLNQLPAIATLLDLLATD